MIELLPLEILLVEYAAGSLSPYEALMVAAHLKLNPEARRKAALFEAEGGKAIAEETPVPLSGNCLEKVLQKIDMCGQNAVSPCAGTSTLPDGIDIPEPIRALLGRSCINNPACWSHPIKGADVINLKVCASEPSRRKLRLAKLAPDVQVPEHHHDGREMTLVLHGSYSDCGGQYVRGDLVVYADHGFHHAPKAGPQGCICILLTDAPLQFDCSFKRIINFFRRF